MRTRSITYEQILYLLAFLLGLSMRLFRLGAAPLSDFEAGWALQALDTARGAVPALGPQPAYTALTSLAFAILPATNFLARLLPALAGSLLVGLPYLAGGWLGDARLLRRAGVLMAFGLAIDPGLVAQSRLAGSSMPAAAFLLLGVCLFLQRRWALSGVLGGLALLSGPTILQGGVVILGLTWLLWRGWQRLTHPPQEAEEKLLPTPTRGELRSLWVALGVTLLAAGLLFLRLPAGLGALADTLPAYLRGWTSPSGVPALRLPLALLLYQPLVLIFGLLAALRGWFNAAEDEQIARWSRRLSLWFVAALVVSMLYPARQVGDLIWALVPAWALAALELARHLPALEERSIRLASALLGGLLVILSVVMWFNLLNMARYQTNYALYLAIILGAFLLGLVSVILVGAGWSLTSARLGTVWGVSMVLALGMFASTWGVAQLRPNAPQELWSVLPAAGQAGELDQTLSDLSVSETGLRQQVDIVVQVESPSLRWLLRDYPRARFTNALAPSETPALVITARDVASPALAQRYRGMDLIWAWGESPTWRSLSLPALLNWVAFRQTVSAPQQIILWVRADVFPGGADTITTIP